MTTSQAKLYPHHRTHVTVNGVTHSSAVIQVGWEHGDKKIEPPELMFRDDEARAIEAQRLVQEILDAGVAPGDPKVVLDEMRTRGWQ